MNQNVLSRCPKLLREWTQDWEVPELADMIQCEWSNRLRSSLGRAYPERNLIRLSILLKDAQCTSLFDEVLCHEAAHIAVFHIHGAEVSTHGPEWEDLVRRAGYSPRTCHESISISPPIDHDRVCYDHICPICHATRTSKQPHPNWRCVACQNAGLDGALNIQSRPAETEVKSD